MTQVEEFSLRWNNFYSNLSSGFVSLLEDEDLVDVTLASGGNFLKAHKIVLSVCSPYFRKLFKANPCKHPIVILRDVDHKELTSLLHFMYRGEVSVREDNLPSFLKTAELLQIKGLTVDRSGDLEPVNNSNTESFPHSLTVPSRDKVNNQLPPLLPKPERTINEDLRSHCPPKKKLRTEVPRHEQSTRVPISSLQKCDESQQSDSQVSEFPSDLNIKMESFDVNNEDEMNASNDKFDYQSQSFDSSTQESLSNSNMFSISNMSESGISNQEPEQGTATFVRSGRGFTMVYKKFNYHLQRHNGNRYYWQCSARRRLRCPGRCVTLFEQVVRANNNHNHEPESQKNSQQTFSERERASLPFAGVSGVF